MDNKKDTRLTFKRLSSSKEYYNNVFKKVEKTVSVIFYILSEIDIKDSQQQYVERIQKQAFVTHELSLASLRLPLHDVTKGLTDVQYELVNLSSILEIAHAVRVLPSDIYNVLYEQLDALQRYIQNHYLSDTGIDISNLGDMIVAKENPKPDQTAAATSVPKSPSSSRQRRVNIPAGDISTDAYLVYSQLTDRAERIKTVLEAKPQSSVKDIAEVITDVSEKTIQRELNSLIEKGQVVREGERRWSKYSVSK